MPGASASARAARALNDTIFNDLQGWGQHLPENLDGLYSSAFAVRCVFNALPPLARLYVMRLLYVGPETSNITVGTFTKSLRRRQRAHDRHDLALRALKAFRVAFVADNGSISLNPPFATQIRSILSGNMPSPFGGPIRDITSVSDRIPQPDALERFSSRRLERILNYLVESNGSDSPSNSILRALVHMNILDDGREGLCISSSGFQFLLKDAFSQVWVLLRSVIGQQHRGAEYQILNFIFQLSFTTVGALYIDNNLGNENRSLLTSLDDLGIIRLEENNMFRPTAVGTSIMTAASRISTGPAKQSVSTAGDIRIVVETNFRVYAYTTSAFQMNLLGLFTHVRYRLPNLVVCHLTRDAVRRALISGIAAHQIIAYLNAHADERSKKGMIPSNVSNEIRLWEGEQERVRDTKGVMITFDSIDEFNRVLAQAQELDACLFKNERRNKPLLIVASDAYRAIKEGSLL